MTASSTPRKPQVFSTDDPNLDLEREFGADFDDGAAPSTSGRVEQVASTPSARFGRSVRWGAIFFSAMFGLAVLAASVSFSTFIGDVVRRQDWVGWVAVSLLGVAGLAFVIVIVRELFGLFRLSRMSRISTEIAAAVRSGDWQREQRAVKRLLGLYRNRADMKWALARMAEHSADSHDSGDLVRLTEREVMAPLDDQAKRLILRSAKRVSMVTALSPMIWIAMLFVVSENVGLLKRLAALYGGRPGTLGALRLARMVFTHIVATGGVAMTDDLLGQFLGQDLLRRLSRRLGEGVFNGALTARVGTAAVDVIRPLPFRETAKVRMRSIVKELVRGTPKQAAAA